MLIHIFYKLGASMNCKFDIGVADMIMNGIRTYAKLLRYAIFLKAGVPKRHNAHFCGAKFVIKLRAANDTFIGALAPEGAGYIFKAGEQAVGNIGHIIEY